MSIRSVLAPLALLALAAILAPAGGCSSLPPETGPTVGVRNDSDAPLRATFWIGDRDEQRPGARADMKPQETLEIPPYGTKQFKLGAFSGFETPAASFVRVQVEPVGTSFQARSQHWFELNPPSPYTLRVYGKKPALKFERVGGGTMVAVPENLWFRNSTGAVAAKPAAATTTKPPLRTVVGTPAAGPVARKTETSRPLTATSVAKPARTTTRVSGITTDE